MTDEINGADLLHKVKWLIINKCCTVQPVLSRHILKRSPSLTIPEIVSFNIITVKLAFLK